jgi:hypothetical protein
VKFTTCENDIWDITVEWLTLLLSIQEVSGLNLSPETNYADFFHGFPKLLYKNARIVPENGSRPLPSTAFSTYHSQIILPLYTTEHMQLENVIK